MPPQARQGIVIRAMSSSTKPNMSPEQSARVARPASLAWAGPHHLVAASSLLVLCWAVVALALAVVGLLHWWLVVPITLVAFLSTRRWIPSGRGGWSPWFLAAVVISAAAGAVALAHPAEHIYTGRDSATYLATAGWLAEDGGLPVDVRDGPLGEFDQLEFDVPGFYDEPLGGTLRPQFMHAFPAMMGTLIDVGGVEAGVALNAFVGSLMLLLVYVLALRFVRPVLALVATASIGLSLVFLYYTRTSFSEPLMAVMVLGGIWLLPVAEERRDLRLGVIAGLLLGGATVIRLDGIVLLLPVTAYLLFRMRSGDESFTVVRGARLAMMGAAFVAIAESLYISPEYILGRRGQVLAVLLALALVFVVNEVIVRSGANLLWFATRHRRGLYWAVTSLLAVALLFGWLARPLISESTGPSYGIEVLQEREGLEIAPERNYAEMSVVWINWYMGPFFIVLGFAGAAVLAHQAAFGGRSGLWLFVSVLGVFATLYLWRPSINPDQIWAMRRYLPVVIPLGSISAVFAIEWAARHLRNRARTGLAMAVAVVGSLGLLVPPMVTSAPVWEFSGLTADFAAMCSDLSPDARILIIDGQSGSLGHRMSQSFRSYCGLEAAWIDRELEGEELGTIAASVDRRGGTLVTVRPAEPGDGTNLDEQYQFLEVTLSRPPGGFQVAHSPVSVETVPVG
jgi:hypothetical protein